MRTNREQTQYILSKIEEYRANRAARAKKLAAVLSSSAAGLLIAGAAILMLIPNLDGDVGGTPTLCAHHALPDVEVTHKLRAVSWLEPDENSPAAELFRQKYGVPEPEKGDNIFEWIRVFYDSRYITLNSMLAAGEPLDMFQFDERAFPLGAYLGQFAPIDELINFNGSEWDATYDAIAQFKLHDRYYVAVTELTDSYSLLFYRKSVIQQHGLPDPYELWRRDNWTWDTFLEICEQFTDADSHRHAVAGWGLDCSVIPTTGTGLITLENGLLKNNMHDWRIENAMDFLHTLAVNDYRYPNHLNNFQIFFDDFVNGNILFWNEPPPFADDEICIVPFPRDPTANHYYQRGNHWGHMLVSSSDNHDGFLAWTQSAVIAAQTPELQQQARERKMAELGLTAHQLNVLEQIRAETIPVWDLKRGIGADSSGQIRVDEFTASVAMYGADYSELREIYGGVIDSAVRRISR
jgi:multiple sugar transport system substrate-binding protein